jgi:hypothetical protein
MALAPPGLDRYLESGALDSDEPEQFWRTAYTTVFHEEPPLEEPFAPGEWDSFMAFWVRRNHRVLLHIHESGVGVLHPGKILTTNKRNSIGVSFVHDTGELNILWINASYWTNLQRVTLLIRTHGADRSRTYEVLEDGSTVRAMPAVTDAPIGDNLITVDLVNNVADAFFGGEGDNNSSMNRGISSS